MQRLYTIAEACEEVRLSRSYLYQLINDGRLESVKIGKRRLIPAAALDAFIDTLTEPGDDMGEVVARSRAEQGLPERIEDPAALDRVARILTTGNDGQRKRATNA